jgi:hypothetical protein
MARSALPKATKLSDDMSGVLLKSAQLSDAGFYLLLSRGFLMQDQANPS